MTRENYKSCSYILLRTEFRSTSMSARRLAWFATEKGKKCVFATLTVTGGSLMCAHIFPHTFFIHKYKEFVQSYRLPAGAVIPQNVQNLVEQVMDDLKMSPQERKLISPFTVFGFDIFHAGTTTSKYGAILGIPESFSYVSKKDVTQQTILVKNEPLEWTDKSSNELVNSLVLSENAKKFAIGREIVSSQTIEPYLNGIFPVTSIFLVYSFTHSLSKRLDLFARPLAMRGVLYCITGLFGFGLWAFSNDFSTTQYEKDADEKMCSLGTDYINGGIEFYTQILQRNKALRHLMGKDGEKLYTVTGNENFFIRQKRLPIGHRKKYIESKLPDVLGA